MSPPANRTLSPEKERLLDAASLSMACYEDDPRVWLNTKISNNADKYHHGITSMSNTIEDEGIRFIIAMNNGGESGKSTMYVAIRGSKNVDNWKSNLNVRDGNIFAAAPGKVHKGFQDLVKLLPLPMLLRELATGNTVTFTGHSLGGAVAALGASELLSIAKGHFCGQIKCITFGAPLYCDKKFSQYTREKTIGDEEAFVHYIDPNDKVPLVLRNLVWETERHAFGRATVPDYHPSGTFRFLPQRTPEEAPTISAEEHVKIGIVSQEMDTGVNTSTGATVPTQAMPAWMTFMYEVFNLVGEMAEVGLPIIKAHMIEGYFESIVDSMDGLIPISAENITVEPFFKENEIIKEILISIKSTRAVDGGNETELRMHVRGFIDVWAARAIKCEDITISSERETTVSSMDEHSFSVQQVAKISQTLNEVLYSFTLKHSSMDLTGLKCSLKTSSIFDSEGDTRLRSRNVTGKVGASYYNSTERRLKIMGIHDVLVFTRSHIYALRNQDEEGHETRFEKDAKIDLKRLDEWMYSMVSKLNSRETDLLEEALGNRVLSVQEEGFENIFEHALSPRLNGKDKAEDGSTRVKVTRSEFSTFVNYNKDDGVVVRAESSKRMELLLHVVLHYVFHQKITGSFMNYKLFLRKKYGKFVEAMNYLVLFFTLGTVDLFNWLPIDTELRGSTVEHQYLLMNVFKEVNVDDVEDVLTQEKNVIQHCSDDDWSLPSFSNKTKKDVKTFMKNFCGPTVALRELCLGKKLYHIALVGQSGAGKTALCTSGFFPHLGVVYQRETTRAAMYPLSNSDFAITDFPGMLGNDSAEFNDAKLNALKETVASIDFVVVFLQVGQRDIDYGPLFETIKGKRSYVCLTHVDEYVLREYRQQTRDESGSGKAILESIIAGLRRRERRFIESFPDLEDVHCLLPFNEDTNASYMGSMIDTITGKRSKVKVIEEEAESLVKEIFSKGQSDLKNKIAEAAKLENIRDEEIKEVLGLESVGA